MAMRKRAAARAAPAECDECGGDGSLKCEECGGEGTVECDDCDGYGNSARHDAANCDDDGCRVCERAEECSTCEGNCYRNCGECGGEGAVRCGTCRGRRAAPA